MTPQLRPETTIGAVTAAPAPASSRRSLRSTVSAGTDVQRGIGRAVAGDDGRGPVVLVAQQPRRVGVEQLTDLDRDGLEQVGGIVALGDERRDATQRRLLVGEHAVLRDVARGGVDRGRARGARRADHWSQRMTPSDRR